MRDANGRFTKGHGFTIEMLNKMKEAKKDYIPWNKDLEGYQAMEKHYNWKGGKTITHNGYILVKMPKHPSAFVTGYVLEHRIVMEKHIGRFLKRNELVHHRNCIKHDNRIENLEIVINGKGMVHQGEVDCPFCYKKFSIR